MRQLALSLIVLSALVASQPGCQAEAGWRSSFEQGQTDLGLQDLPKAEADFRQALKLVQSQTHDTDALANCVNKLADTLALREKTAEAKSLYQRALSLLENKYGPTSPKIAPALISLGSILEAEGNSEAAMGYYQRAFKINEKNYGPYSPEIVSPLHHLAKATARAGHREEAKKHYKVALSVLLQEPSLSASREMQSLLGDYSDLSNAQDRSNEDLLQDFKSEILTKSAPAANVSAGLTGQSAQSDESSSWQKQSSANAVNRQARITAEAPGVVARQEAAVSLDETLSPAYSTMSNVIFDQGHYDQGEQFYERKVALDIKALGADHPSVANDLNALAMSYIGSQKYSDADVLLTRALSIYKKVYGQNNVLTVRTQAQLAGVKLRLRQFEQAAQLYRATLNFALSALGPNHIESARILNDLAYLYYNQNRLNDALTYYQWALASTQAAVGDKDPLYAACLRDYARVLRSLGRTSEALVAESRADGILATN